MAVHVFAGARPIVNVGRNIRQSGQRWKDHGADQESAQDS